MQRDASVCCNLADLITQAITSKVVELQAESTVAAPSRTRGSPSRIGTPRGAVDVVKTRPGGCAVNHRLNGAFIGRCICMQPNA